MSQVTIQITTGTIVRVLLVIGVAALVWYLRELALIVLTSIVIASAIEPVAKSVTKYRVPRTVAVLAVYLLFFGIFSSIVFFLLPPVLREVSVLLSTLPAYLDTLNLHTTGALTADAAAQTRSLFGDFSLGQTAQQLNAIVSGLSGNFLATMSLIFGGVLSFLLIVVFSFYFAINERGIEDFLRVITPVQHESYIIGLWRRSQHKIGLWMQGQFLLALIIGVLVYLGLSILGVPYALVLAVIAAAMELIPVFGPILASIPAIGIAFIDGGLTIALLVLAFYVIIHQFENHLIYPLVVTKVVGVPPILVILALFIGAQLAGILGILLSVPVAAVLQELFADLEKTRGSLKQHA